MTDSAAYQVQSPQSPRFTANPAAGRIEVRALTKVFGGSNKSGSTRGVRAVDGLSFDVEPGAVTGFLGPNGAGKTTTLRMILGLVHPSAGTATIGGLPYRQLRDPVRVVGAALEASSFHPARTARNQLRIICAAAGLPDRRADEVLGLVGLTDVAKRKVRGFSMGMRQRLSLAATLLGDPQVLVLDEPANGLDPDGIRWLRGFFRFLAGEGRTVLVSSHQLNEVQEVADRVVILNRGQLVRAGSISELTAGSDSVVVRTPQPQVLADALAQAGIGGGYDPAADGLAPALRVHIGDPARVGHVAFVAGVEIHELRLDRFDLEQLFFALTQAQFTAPSPGSLPAGSP